MLVLFLLVIESLASTKSAPTPTTSASVASTNPVSECPQNHHYSNPKIALWEPHCAPNGTFFRKFALPRDGCTCDEGYFRTTVGCISNYHCSFQFFCRVNEEIGTGYCDRLCIFGKKGMVCSKNPSSVYPRCQCKEGYLRYPPAPYECKAAYRCLY